MDYTKEYLKYKRNKKLKGIFIGFGILLIAIIGSTYAFFTYSKSLQAFTLTSSGITASFGGGSNQINITSGYPISDEFAILNLNQLDYIDFTISGNVEDENQGITYEIYLTEDDNNTLDPNYIKVYITDENGEKLKDPRIYNSLDYTTYSKDATTGKVIYKLEGISSNYSKSFRIYAWIDKDYEQNEVSQEFSFYVNLYAYNDENKEGAYLLEKKIASLKEDNPSCNYVVKDYKTGEELEATYLSGPGTGECAIDFNYVWWSGMMWRITAIYPDGSMKMITENMITSIAYNEENNFTYYDKTNGTKSYMFQWLNEDFKDILYNQGAGVIDTTKNWNAKLNASANKPSEVTATMIPSDISPVGLLNSYEYYKSFQNSNSANGYLNIQLLWFLLNPYNSSYFNGVYSNGNIDTTCSPNSTYGVRPSIYLKPKISLTGEGTKEKPYRLLYDYVDSSPNEKINTRHSGEYLKFDVDGNNGNYDDAPLFRIVGVDGVGDLRTTKIVAMDYITFDDNGETKFKKKFASSTIFGDSNNNKNNEYWDYYLNNEWYNGLPFKEKLTNGTYYLGALENKFYKTAVCKNVDNYTTSECLSDSNKRVTTTFQGKVGLLRYGEMFATQQKSGLLSLTPIWLITGSGNVVHNINSIGAGNYFTSTSLLALRPSYHLNSTVKIVSGSGTELDPYIVS